VKRLPFNVLDGLLRRLTDRLAERKISLQAYLDEYERVLEFAGWTDEQLQEAVDERWTAPSKPAQVFLC
jgi:hypothetical protein